MESFYATMRQTVVKHQVDDDIAKFLTLKRSIAPKAKLTYREYLGELDVLRRLLLRMLYPKNKLKNNEQIHPLGLGHVPRWLGFNPLLS